MNDQNSISAAMTALPSRQTTSIGGPRKALQHIGVKEGMNIADLGCGSGYFTIPAAKMVGDDATVYAIDILKTTLEHVKSRAKLEGLHNVKTVWANLEIVGSTQLNPGAVDMSFVSSALYQTKHPEKFLEEAKRILTPQGKLIIFEWETDHIPIGPKVEHRMTEQETIDLAKSMGLKLADQFKPGAHHYGLIFSK